LIYDCFLFFNELDLLECRLRELENTPVMHVLAEAPLTFQGNPKPLYFAENQERFAPWKDRITHVILNDIQGDTAWERESDQRRCLTRGLEDADPDDLILLGDVDEIPRASVVRKNMGQLMVLEMQYRPFAVDWLHPLPWYGTVTSRVKYVTDLEELRNMRKILMRTGNAGWHFSFLGGPAAIKEKAAAFSHDDLSEKIAGWADEGCLYQSGKCWTDDTEFSLNTQLLKADTSDLPLWIRERKCPHEWFRELCGSYHGCGDRPRGEHGNAAFRHIPVL